MDEYKAVDDVTRIRCQHYLGKFRLWLLMIRNLEQLQISFVHCNSGGRFLLRNAVYS